jgi:hypothetical protein
MRGRLPFLPRISEICDLLKLTLYLGFNVSWPRFDRPSEVLSPPKSFEPAAGDTRVSDGVLRILVAEIILHCPEVDALVCQIIAT